MAEIRFAASLTIPDPAGIVFANAKYLQKLLRLHLFLSTYIGGRSNLI